VDSKLDIFVAFNLNNEFGKKKKALEDLAIGHI